MKTLSTDIPGRLDRLPWSGWHWRVVFALGITWALDGLEVTLVGAVGSVLNQRSTLGLTETQVGAAASAYLAGAIVGALLFGWLTDRFGRKKLFLVTLSVYLVATLLTALSVGPWSFAFFRALTGAGIGGEYSAINSAIDELLPARVRGRADLAINSTYWLGALIGALGTLVLLDPRLVPEAIGWRLCFGLGAVLGTAVLATRRHLPESPRWLIRHGREPEAEAIVSKLEKESAGVPREPAKRYVVEVTGPVGLRRVAHVLFVEHRRRSLLGLSLMVAQAFAYNAIFFTYPLVLTRFYGVPAGRGGLYLIPFAIGNLLGPLLLGHLFDTVGRKPMISATYGLAGLLLGVSGLGFRLGWWTAVSQVGMWCAVFFVASAAASSAYLSVSELFPVELRGLAIAFFYAVGTAIGGLAAPAVFGALIQTGRREALFLGYCVGAVLLLAAAVCEAVLGVAAEGQSLEALAGGVTERGAAPGRS